MAKRETVEPQPPPTPRSAREAAGDLLDEAPTPIKKHPRPFKRPRLRSPKLSRIYNSSKEEVQRRKPQRGQPLRLPRPSPSMAEEPDFAAAVDEEDAAAFPPDDSFGEEDFAADADDPAAGEEMPSDGIEEDPEHEESYLEATEHLEDEEF